MRLHAETDYYARLAEIVVIVGTLVLVLMQTVPHLLKYFAGVGELVKQAALKI